MQKYIKYLIKKLISSNSQRPKLKQKINLIFQAINHKKVVISYLIIVNITYYTTTIVSNHMFSISDHYTAKTIAILGAKSSVGKVLLRQLLITSQLGLKFDHLIIIDVKNKNTKRELKLENYFADEFLFSGLNLQNCRNKIELFQIEAEQDSKNGENTLVNSNQMRKGHTLPHIDILFNCYLPEDFTRSGIQKCLDAHIWKTKQICKSLNSQCPSIATFISVSSIYCQNPGYISEGETLKNQQNQNIQFCPPDSITKKRLIETLQDVFTSDQEIWQWSIQYMEYLYSHILSTLIKQVHHIVRLPLLGPSLVNYEGYLNNFNSLMNLLYEVGNGFIDRLQGVQENIIDMVPIDYVVNYLITIAVVQLPTPVIESAIDELEEGKLPNTNKTNSLDLTFNNNDENQKNICHQVSLHNFSTSTRNPAHLSAFSQYIVQAWREYSKIENPNRISLSIQEKKWQKKVYNIQKQLPKTAKSRLASLFDIKPWKIQSQQDQISLNKKNQIIKKYKFYLSREWICESNKSIDYFFALSHEDQQLFHFNVNSINWKTYAKLCCYSINKHLLGMEVQKFNPASLDLLSMQKSSYFSDVMWAMTEGKSIDAQNSQQIKKYILSTKSVKQAIKTLVEEQTGKLEQTPMSYENVQAEFYKIADQMCEQMFSQYSMKSIRGFAWFLHKVFRTIYEKVVVDKNAITKLRNHNQSEGGPIIIIPTHRSYIDFLIMSYVFFGYGIKCPHIAAAEDFLNMAVVHILLRKSGAFFIKRNMKKNRLLYKAIMTQYISKLLGENHYLEFFIEGTRSRVGKMLSPKYGILSIVAKNVLDGKIPDAQILPITLNYEKVLEGESFTYQMMGQSKVKESLKRVIKAADILKENFGRIYIDLCDMISVKKYFGENFTKFTEQNLPQQEISRKFQGTLEKLGYKIVYEMTSKLIITPPAILASVLLMNRIGISDDRLAQKVQWLCRQITSRGIKVARTQADSSISINSTLNLLQDIVNKSRKDMFQVQVSFDQNSFKQLFTLTYYRNTLTHIFFEEALIAVALGTFGHQSMITGSINLKQLKESVMFLAKLLNKEFVLERYLDQQGRIEQVLHYMESKETIKLMKSQGSIKICVPNPESNMFAFLCSLIWPVVESYWIACLYLFKLSKDNIALPLEKLQSQIQWFGQSLFTERIILHLEAISIDTIRNATSQLIKMKTIKQGSKNGKIGMVVIASEEELKILETKISVYLKSKYAGSLKGVIGMGRGSSAVNVDFPFLPKM